MYFWKELIRFLEKINDTKRIAFLNKNTCIKNGYLCKWIFYMYM